jgi:hypothetical protein
MKKGEKCFECLYMRNVALELFIFTHLNMKKGGEPDFYFLEEETNLIGLMPRTHILIIIINIKIINRKI